MAGLAGFVIVFILVCLVSRTIYNVVYSGRFESAFGKFVLNYIAKTVIVAFILGVMTCTGIEGNPSDAKNPTAEISVR